MAFGLDDAIGAGLQIVNKLIPDPAERAKAELEIFRMKQSGEFKELQAALSLQAELTKRAENDMASDSWLSKNIRPLVMIFLLGLVTLSGFEVLSVKEEFLSMVRSFTEYGLMFYFGGRTLEKVASIALPIFKKGT
jgi:hypothetical protein